MLKNITLLAILLVVATAAKAHECQTLRPVNPEITVVPAGSR